MLFSSAGGYASGYVCAAYLDLFRFLLLIDFHVFFSRNNSQSDNVVLWCTFALIRHTESHCFVASPNFHKHDKRHKT